jgi:oxygen-independent coproporphyrinogen-3 oxidase
MSEETTAGSYFVSNYPPYSYWNAEEVAAAQAALDRPARPDAPLGVYVHIPFCRKRCHFCYFKVYTGKDSTEIDRYLDALVAELTAYSGKPFIDGRKPSFIYFGGGTPSYLSTKQLSRIVDAMKRVMPWDEAQEITFECEPGTITEGKLEILRQIGVTRLSLGVENFNRRFWRSTGERMARRRSDGRTRSRGRSGSRRSMWI